MKPIEMDGQRELNPWTLDIHSSGVWIVTDATVFYRHQQEGHGKVIVMELCTGGSLFNMLDDPENAYGLDEKEFFLVLRHLCTYHPPQLF